MSLIVHPSRVESQPEQRINITSGLDRRDVGLGRVGGIERDAREGSARRAGERATICASIDSVDYPSVDAMPLTPCCGDSLDQAARVARLSNDPSAASHNSRN